MLHPSGIASESPLRKKDENWDRIHLNGLLFHGFHGVIPEVSRTRSALLIPQRICIGLKRH